ncbi:hypothetical protein [Streptomyces microflavus]|uniref:Uncharacterized protein n=1 Tax=Streptomyces microflavus TaxID=1919 RepID=A0A7H8MQ39_STRMI|nr:hypothetical protein [Streptomyces microflavus]QKW44268.1 hypothetical protein HUT09_17945 [Streptomyces microflavus]
MSWITWAFGGVGVAVPIALIGWFYFDRKKNQDRQVQKSGSDSINYQAGGNMRVDGNSEIRRQEP